MILVYSCAQELLVGLVGSMEELVPCASPTTCGKCFLAWNRNSMAYCDLSLVLVAQLLLQIQC